ncbi:MAG: hypothetical protein KJN83_08070 [Nitrosopumilus sp.]|nr:hypothetical protein [Nitrosopumilus sp.]
MRIQTISIVSLAVVISFVAYGTYLIHNPQLDLEKTEKIHQMVSVQLEKCLMEFQSVEICNALIEEYTQSARLELGY